MMKASKRFKALAKDTFNRDAYKGVCYPIYGQAWDEVIVRKNKVMRVRHEHDGFTTITTSRDYRKFSYARRHEYFTNRGTGSRNLFRLIGRTFEKGLPKILAEMRDKQFPVECVVKMI